MEQERKVDESPRTSGTRVISILYVVFFAVWCVGLAMGEAWTGGSQPVVFGIPAWFFVGCVLSFIGISVALYFCVRRYF